MGLLQKAFETYEYHQNLAGKMEYGKEPLAPCAHKTVQADIEITIDQDGRFISASVRDTKEPKILIPVTEKSAGRSGTKPAPHPLCDKLAYLIPYNEGKYRRYVEQLRAWQESDFSHPKLTPILNYITGETIVGDLLTAGIIEQKAGKTSGQDLLVCWIVVGLGLDQSGPCWTDVSLFSAFEQYYRRKKSEEGRTLCMITGEQAVQAKQHLKGVVSKHGNAKLISSDDKSNFTYRGRFTSVGEAETVSYEASQKAHNALRWLIANQGISLGERIFVCWEPRQIKLPNPMNAFLPQLEEKLTPSDYQIQLQNTLKGWKSALPDSASAVIAALDAATKGRLSVTYYNELQASDFMERLRDWDAHCCWLKGRRGEFGVQAPSIWQIVHCTFGTQRKSKAGAELVTDTHLLRQQAQRLVACRIDRARIPADLVKKLTVRYASALAYKPEIRENFLFVACAVTRKYRYDQYKEEWDMALEPEKQDRSYQYGRLLAVLEKVERDTYGNDEKREPNAIRMMSVFMQRPQYAANRLNVHIKTAYYPKISPADRVYYDSLLQDIYAMIARCGENEAGRPLGETCMMGYYLQRKALYTQTENGGKEE